MMDRRFDAGLRRTDGARDSCSAEGGGARLTTQEQVSNEQEEEGGLDQGTPPLIDVGGYMYGR